MFEKLTFNKYFIMMETVIGISVIVIAIIKQSLLFAILGIALIGIQILKIYSKKEKKDIGIVGDTTKGKWGK